MKNLARGAIVAAAAMLAGCSTARTVETVSGGEVALVRPKALELKNNMRRLWTDHVSWTRGYIVAAVANDPSASAQASRLMRNQEDIGNAVATYYGSAAGAKLTDLLKQHINIAVDLVTAAKAGDNAKVSDADRRWHDNARDIAAFLAGANPNWSRDALVNMLNEHLSLTTEEALARIQKRWTDDTVAFDRILTQALMMADALTDGIVKQFPSKV
ncbi:MAG: glycosyltransferase [Betaproteobacteria bacterium]|nr:MAG: glycosyltransferase [Betaproteobacteria bacterium]